MLLLNTFSSKGSTILVLNSRYVVLEVSTLEFRLVVEWIQKVFVSLDPEGFRIFWVLIQKGFHIFG